MALSGNAGIVLEARETLLLAGGDDPAVDHQGRRRVVGVIDAQDFHAGILMMNSLDGSPSARCGQRRTLLLCVSMSDQDKTQGGPQDRRSRRAFPGRHGPGGGGAQRDVHFDRRLLRDDVRGSQAHARMLAAVELISAADAEPIVAGLDQVAGEFERGERALDPALEDIHMNVESRLIELIGEPAAACTPRAAATIRWRPTCGSTRGARPRHRGRPSTGRAWRSAGRRASTRRRCCPGTRTCSARRW